MTHFIAKTAMAALLALASVPVTAATANAAGFERAPVVDVQFRQRHACSPVQAVQKARMRGMRAARITSVTPRRVVVSGRDRYGWDRMVFANVRGCPMIRR